MTPMGKEPGQIIGLHIKALDKRPRKPDPIHPPEQRKQF